MRFLRIPLNELLAQFRLQHLARFVLWQRLDEAILLRPFEARDMVEAVGVEGVWVERHAAGAGCTGVCRHRVAWRAARDDEGNHFLTLFWMRAPHH